MSRRATVFLVLALLAGACRGDGPLTERRRQGPAERLTELATKGDAVTYKATYRYEVTPLKESQETRVIIVSRPPDSLRHTDVVTRARGGQEVSVPQWLFQKNGEFFTCFKVGTVQCRVNTTPASRFGHNDLDDFYELVRKPDSFQTVREIERAEIAGESARCFRATPPHPAAPSATPTPAASGSPRSALSARTADAFEFELCYAADGLLLRGRRTLLGPLRTGSSGRPTANLEAVSVTRKVSDDDLKLPAPVTPGVQSPARTSASPGRSGTPASTSGTPAASPRRTAAATDERL